MSLPSFVYLDNTHCSGPHFSQPLHHSQGLPPASVLAGSLEGTGPRVALLIKDDLLHPLQVALKETVPAKERQQFLLWKLKGFLPYAVEEVSMRSLPLAEPGAYLTFSLPSPWLKGVHEACQSKGIHCGYVGGLFTTLLENTRRFRNALSLAIFPDFYMLAQLNGRGDWQRCKIRRLPFAADGSLDVKTLAHADLIPLIRAANGLSGHLLCLAPQLDPAVAILSQILTQEGCPLTLFQQGPDPLSRFQNLWEAAS